MERNSSGDIVPGKSGQTLCQELIISLSAPGSKIDYTPTSTGCVPPLTVMACVPGWDDYFNLNETLAKMTQHLMDEDGQLMDSAPRGGTPVQKDDKVKIVVIPPNDDTVFVPTLEFPGTHLLGTADNPVNLSDAPTEASNTGAHPQGMDPLDESKILSHFSNTLDMMAQSIADLEDGYFMALREVIHETEKALWDVSQIDSTYISRTITVMAGWQEAIQAIESHMESTDTTIYLAHRKDVRRVMREYVDEVIKAREQCNATNAKEGELWKQAIKTGDPEDLIIRLLEATWKAVHAQAKRAVDIFLNKI